MFHVLRSKDDPARNVRAQEVYSQNVKLDCWLVGQGKIIQRWEGRGGRGGGTGELRSRHRNWFWCP